MKKDNVIRRLKFFNTIDIASITEYLESMAERGYFFYGCRGIFYTFEKGQPEKRKYHIELFSNGSMFGTLGDSVGAREFAYKWESRGWKFIDSTGTHIFFVAVDDDAEIVELDPKETFEQIKGCMKNEIISALIFMFLSVFNITTNIESSWPTEFIEYGNIVLAWSILFVVVGASLIRNLIFYFKNSSRAKNNLSIIYPKSRTTKIFNRAVSCIFAIGLVVLLGGLLMGERNILLGSLVAIAIMLVLVNWGIELIRNKDGHKSKAKSIATAIALVIIGSVIVFVVAILFSMFDGNNKRIEYQDIDGNTVIESVSDDEIPLVLEDLGVDTFGMIQADTCSEEYYSIYGSIKSGWQNYYIGNDEDIADISYTLVHCNFQWVKEKLLEGYMTDDTFIEPLVEATEEEVALWGAEEVFRSGGARLVIYEKDVLFITNSEVDYTEEVIGTIISKLEML